MVAKIKFVGTELLEFFKAAKPFWSTEETRCYLNGIYFEPLPDGAVGTATNGHILINKKLYSPEHEGEIKPFILHRNDIVRLIKTFPKDTDVLLKQEDDGELVFDFFDFEYRCKPVDGTYPDYTLVMPKNTSMKAEGLRADYVRAALSALGKKPVNIEQADDPATPQVFTSNEAEGLTCIVMPMRTGIAAEEETKKAA